MQLSTNVAKAYYKVVYRSMENLATILSNTVYGITFEAETFMVRVENCCTYNSMNDFLIHTEIYSLLKENLFQDDAVIGN